MRITALKPVPRDRRRIEVSLDGEPATTLGGALSAGLKIGQELEPAELAALERRDQADRARDAALTLLSHRARTAAELTRRLLRKGFAADVAEACVQALAADGWLSDDAFAESFVRDRIRSRPRARRHMIQELAARGVDRSRAGRAVEAVFHDEDVSETSLARRAAESWWRRNAPAGGAPDPRSDEGRRLRRRLWGHLARRGFGGEVIRAVCTPLLEGARTIDGAPGAP